MEAFISPRIDYTYKSLDYIFLSSFFQFIRFLYKMCTLERKKEIVFMGLLRVSSPSKSLALILIYSPSCCSKPVFLSFFSRMEKKDDIFLPYSKVYRNEKQKRAGVFIYSQIRSRPRVRVNQLSFDLSYKAVTWLWKTWNIVQMLCLWSTFSSSCAFGKKKKTTFSSTSFPVFYERKKVIQVWNNMWADTFSSLG